MTDKAKGFYRHANSKEHLACMAIWKEQQLRCSTGKEISTLDNSDQLSRNCLHVSAIIDIIEFLVSNELSLSQADSRLFLSLCLFPEKKQRASPGLQYNSQKNATYTSHDVKNYLI